jgi:processing peptidase subunit beta
MSAFKIGQQVLRAGQRSYSVSTAAASAQITTLSNGFRVATETTPNKTATVGVYIDAGSRFETAQNNGTAHFLEHMAFKGTSKRSQASLELEVENMGALLNAYTSRELTTYYAKCFSSDVGHATEILSDLILNSTFDEAAVQAERGVILREMQEVNDIPEEVVLDYLHATAYQGTSLGYTILGPEENIRTITSGDLKQYVDTHYTAPRMVLAGAGGVVHEELVELAEKYFGNLSADHNAPTDVPKKFTGSDIRARDDSKEVGHFAIAVEAVDHTHKDYYPLMVASTIVGNYDRAQGGGQHMSSELARNCAEFGYATSYMSFLTSYSDTGLWGNYATCTPMGLDDYCYALQQEWMRITASCTELDVQRAKNQLRAALSFANDGSTAVCDELGRQVLTHGDRKSPMELETDIQGVTVDSVKAVMDEYVYDTSPAVVGVGAIEGLTDYNRIASDMQWSRF